jgi:hypothetical protein
VNFRTVIVGLKSALQEELDKRGVKYSDLFEKSGFVERLAKSANERVDKMEPQGSQVENRANNETKQPEPAKASLEQSIREEVESMSLPSIRKELTSLGISTRGAFEKPVIRFGELCSKIVHDVRFCCRNSLNCFAKQE